MKTEASVQTTDSVTRDDLLDSLDCGETGLIAELIVARSIGASLSTVPHQDRSLHNIFGEFKGALLKVSLMRRQLNRLWGESYMQGEKR